MHRLSMGGVLALLWALALSAPAWAIGPNGPGPRPGTSPQTPALTGQTSQGHMIDPGRVIFKLAPEVKLVKALEAAALPGVTVREASKLYPRHETLNAEELAKGWVDLSRIYELKLGPEAPVEAIVWRLARTAGVVYAEPRYIHQVFYTPNDPQRINQNFLQVIGAYAAWDLSKGDSTTVIGIVDSGMDLDHPDMIANHAFNRADPINGIDDDNDGFVDNYLGWDFAGADFNNIVQDNNAQIMGANNNHGSHVGGLASAVTDNGVGVSGIGFNCRLLPVKCSADNDRRFGGLGGILAGYEGIVFAADMGAQIINCSWGGGGRSTYEQDIIYYALRNRQALVVAAAGNSNSTGLFFPASYEGVLSVAATANNDTRAGFSNYNTQVAISAPGVLTFSALYDNAYGPMTGTSMAAPIVAGAAGLIRSLHPTYTPEQIRAVLTSSSTDIYQVAGNDNAQGRLGMGRLNIGAAVTYQGPAIRLRRYRAFNGFDENLISGDTVDLTLTLRNILAPSTGVTAIVSTFDSRVFIYPGTESQPIPNLGTGDSATLAAPVKLALDNSIPRDAEILLRVDYVGPSGYQDLEYIILNVNQSFVDFEHNLISSTAHSEGRLGSDNTLASPRGRGLRYRGRGPLDYEMAVMMGTSTSRVSDNARAGMGFNNHLRALELIRKAGPGGPAPFEYTARFADIGAPFPLQARTRHRTYVFTQAPDTSYYIYEMTIENRSNQDWQQFAVGLFADLDIGPNYSANTGAIDTARNRRMVYLYDTSPDGLYAGVALLTPGQLNGQVLDNNSPYLGISVNGGFATAQKYTAMTSGVPRLALGANVDASMVIASSGHTVAAGDSIKVAFAIMAGPNRAALENSAQAAQNRYRTTLTSTRRQATAAPQASKLQVWPSPARGSAFVRVQGEVNQSPGTPLPPRIHLVSPIGQRISPLSVEKASGGAWQVRWSAALPPGLYRIEFAEGVGRPHLAPLVIE